jgi:hypothetical protein
MSILQEKHLILYLLFLPKCQDLLLVSITFKKIKRKKFLQKIKNFLQKNKKRSLKREKKRNI